MNQHNDFLSHAAEYARQSQPARSHTEQFARHIGGNVFWPGQDDRLQGSIVGWIERYPAVYGHLISGASQGNTFYQSLATYLGRNGCLTERQLAAVERDMDKAAGVVQERQVASAAPQVSVAGAGFSKLLDGFQAAQNSGLRRPKLRIGNLKFSLAPENGRNAGYIYVKTVEAGEYLGKISPTGTWSKSYECTSVQAGQVAEVGRDPFGALVAHGHRTGNCGICNRKLSDPESVTRGIGPTCAAKYSWV